MERTLLAIALAIIVGLSATTYALVTTEPVIITETVTKVVEVEREVEVIVTEEVTVGFDHAQHALNLGPMTDDERICNLAIQPLAQLAYELLSPMVCIRSFNDYAGLYTGNVLIMTAPGVEMSYYLEVAAHELGHAYDWTQLTDTERDEVNAIMGWEMFNSEHFADVFAYDIGYWTDYGTGWRHDGTAPTELELTELRAAGLLLEDSSSSFAAKLP